MELFNIAKIKNLLHWSSIKKGNLEVQQKQKQGDSTAVQQKGERNEAHIGDTDQSVLIRNSILNNPIFNGLDESQIQRIKDQNMIQLEDRLKEIPQEQQTPIKPNPTYKALLGLQFVDENEIADMFIELLAKAGDKRYAGKVHPNYQDIVSRLSPDEAKMLEKLYSHTSKHKGEVPRSQSVHRRDALAESLHITIQEVDRQVTLLQSLGLVQVKSKVTNSFTPHLGRWQLQRHMMDSIPRAIDTIEQEFAQVHKAVGDLLRADESWNVGTSHEDKIALTELGKQFLDVVFQSKDGSGTIK